jgi:hypothetical protein
LQSSNQDHATDAVCELPLRLSAVFFRDRRPRRSFAIVRGAAPGSATLAAPGMRFADHTLVEVQPYAARFEHGGESCWLRMFGPNARDKIEVEQTNAQAERYAGKRRGRYRRRAVLRDYPPTRTLGPAELARVSHEQPSGGFLLNRQLLRKALTRWSHIAATTRLVRTGRHRSSGMRIVSLRNAGLLSHIGLRSNDVLRKLNGGSFREPDLRPAFEALAGGDHNTLTLQRGRQEITLVYTTR